MDDKISKNSEIKSASRTKHTKRVKSENHFIGNPLNDADRQKKKSVKNRKRHLKDFRAAKDGGFKLVQKRLDDAIEALVWWVRRREPRMGPRSKFGGNVYEATTEIVHAWEALLDWRSAHADDYKTEIERRRQIGLAIDPATAETMFWWADINDPYGIRDPEIWHEGQVGREQFARSPGGEWVDFDDLPAATRKTLWKRDGHKLSFPYGLNPGDDVINYPPEVQS